MSEITRKILLFSLRKQPLPTALALGLLLVYLLAALVLFVAMPMILTARFEALILPYLVGSMYMAAAVWAFVSRYQEAAGRAFSVFGVSMALVAVGSFSLADERLISQVWVAALTLAGAGIINLAMTYPAMINA